MIKIDVDLNTINYIICLMTSSHCLFHENKYQDQYVCDIQLCHIKLDNNNNNNNNNNNTVLLILLLFYQPILFLCSCLQ